MRTLFRLIAFLIILGSIVTLGIFAFVALDLEIPFDFFNRSRRNTLPTVTPASTDGTAVAGPPITSSDGCVIAQATDPTDTDGPRRGRPEQLPPAARGLPPGMRANVTPPGRAAPNQVVIQFTPSSSQQERAMYIRSINGRSRRTVDQLNTFVVTLPPDVDPTSLPSSPIVVTAEPDFYASATQDLTAPNDPRYPEQWALPMIGVTSVWQSLPSDAPNVTVAVIDSGICADHPDLAGRIVAGWDFVDEDSDPQDSFGHGCGVAGVIAANVNNSIGMAGVAPHARVMPLRVLNEVGLGTYSDISAAIVHAADNGAQVINLSLAGPERSQVLEDAIDYAVERGVIVVAAAGNNGTEGIWNPAAYDPVVAVGSVDQDLQRSDFSNFGTQLDVLAPGRDILTTSVDSSYMTMTGTSFAVPQVTGVAALTIALETNLNIEDGVIFIYAPEVTLRCE